MKARIIEIADEEITLKSENGKFKKVSRELLKFEYKLGDTIEVEYDGKKYYYLPPEGAEVYVDSSTYAAPSVKKKSAPSKEKKNLKGIGGPLVVLIVLCFLLVAWFIVAIAENNGANFSCSQLSSVIDNRTCNSLKGLASVEVVATVIGAIGFLVSGVLLSTRKRAGRTMTVLMLLAYLGWVIIDFAVANSILSGTSAARFIDGEAALPIVLWSILNVIWVPYLLSSSRVKNTLVE